LSLGDSHAEHNARFSDSKMVNFDQGPTVQTGLTLAVETHTNRCSSKSLLARSLWTFL
jgi:hypothetical protein